MFGDRPVRIGGICKGSGMIHPNMATMLAFVTCDAAVSSHLWQEMVSRAANRSFNQITVDGDTSTNDSLIALANGQSRTPAITEMGADAEKLEAMLTSVCVHLAKAIARDGEGATCLVEVQVSGALDEVSASKIAKTIVGSSLVKAAIFGRDPNYFRTRSELGENCGGGWARWCTFRSRKFADSIRGFFDDGKRATEGVRSRCCE